MSAIRIPLVISEPVCQRRYWLSDAVPIHMDGKGGTWSCLSRKNDGGVSLPNDTLASRCGPTAPVTTRVPMSVIKFYRHFQNLHQKDIGSPDARYRFTLMGRKAELGHVLANFRDQLATWFPDLSDVCTTHQVALATDGLHQQRYHQVRPNSSCLPSCVRVRDRKFRSCSEPV
jgi:hypothetical protein